MTRITFLKVPNYIIINKLFGSNIYLRAPKFEVNNKANNEKQLHFHHGIISFVPAQISRKTDISYPFIRTRQGVRNVSFS